MCAPCLNIMVVENCMGVLHTGEWYVWMCIACITAHYKCGYVSVWMWWVWAFCVGV